MNSYNKTAKIAGFGYLIIIIAGIFSEFFIRSSLIITGDAATTAANISASESLFRISIGGDLVMLLFDVILALALYVLLKPVNKGLALLAAFFRLVHAAIYGANLLNLYFVSRLASGATFMQSFDTSQIQELIMLFLNAHSFGYVIGLVFFGIHCLILGYLIYESGYFPRILGVLILLAGLGYLIDCYANILMLNYARYADIFAMIVFIPAVVGELSLSLYLLIKRINIPEIQT